MSAVKRAAVAFGRFWWDFLIGDTPELLVAVLCVIGLAIALHTTSSAAVPVVLAAVVAFLAASTWRGRRRAS